MDIFISTDHKQKNTLANLIICFLSNALFFLVSMFIITFFLYLFRKFTFFYFINHSHSLYIMVQGECLVFLSLQQMKFSIKDFFSKFDQICRFLRTWSHLLRKSWMEDFIFCALYFVV